jgi:hypothetical protein
MQFNLDKRFIKILNNQGHNVTWEQLREAYTVRKKERDKEAQRAIKNSLAAPPRPSSSLTEAEAEALFLRHL